MSTSLTVDLESLFSYLCMYIDDDLAEVYFNLKNVNEGYIKTLEDIKKTDDPTKFTMSFMDMEDKRMVSFITPFDKEAVEKIELVSYTRSEILEIHPELFEE